MDRPDLERVTERIENAVAEFCERTREFHMADLAAFVEERVGVVAPDSPGRILRMLRQAAKVSYRVVDRSTSRYEIIRPAPTQTTFKDFRASQEWRDDG